jgi:hypothetical protein
MRRAGCVGLAVAALLVGGCGADRAPERDGAKRTALGGLAQVDSTVQVMRAGRRSWLVVRRYTARVPGGWGVKVQYRCQAMYTYWPRRGWSPWRCAV